MCYAIYAVLLLVAGVYCDAQLQSVALSTSTGDDGWMVIALGWEIIPQLWPLLFLAAVFSSLLTYLVVGRMTVRKKG